MFLLISLLLFRFVTKGNESFIFNGIKLYFYLAQKFWNGAIPYLDFNFEYPPLTIILFTIPLFFVRNFISYIFSFVFLNLVCTTILFLVSNKFLKLLDFSDLKREKILTFEFIFFFLFFKFFVIVYDVYPALFVLLGLYYYFSYLKKEKDIFHILSYLFILIGGFLKLYPFLLLPLFLIIDLQNKKYKVLIKTGIINFLVFIPQLVFLIYAKDGLIYFLHYHSQRGLHIESVYSSFIFILEKINIIQDSVMRFDFGSTNIYGLLPDLLSNISFYIFFIFYFLFLYFFLKSKQKNIFKKIIISAVIIILLFILFNKVFSTQYVLWLFPLFFLVDFSYLEKEDNLYIFFLFITFVSNLIYPDLSKIPYQDYLFLKIVILFRNILLFFLLYKILFLFKKKYMK